MATKAHTDHWTVALALSTVAAIVLAGTMLRGAGLFFEDGRWLTLEELDHIGSWLGGLFAPTALAWTARAFFLQRQQMAEDAAQAIDARERERREDAAALLRENPINASSFVVNMGSDGKVSSADITMTNVGSPVSHITAHVFAVDAWIDHISSGQAPPASDTMHALGPLMSGGALTFRLPLASAQIDPVNLRLEAIVYSVRRDGLVWREEVFSKPDGSFEKTSARFAGEDGD